MNDRARKTTTPANPCSRTHAVALYDVGCRYAQQLEQAAQAALASDSEETTRRFAAADSLLWELANLNNPEDLRDFIAGAHHRHEQRLLLLGLPVQH